MISFFSQQPLSFWFVIASYGLLLAGVSIYFARFVKNTDDFFRASGRTSWWISGLSFFMTAFSASVFVANASLAYNYGTLNILLILAQLPVFAFGYYLFSRKWHRAGCQTAIEFIEKRYSRSTAKFFAWTGIPMRILDNANRLYVTAVLIEVLFGLDLWVAILFTCVVTLVYTIAGGFLAVIVTDALQAIMLGIVVLVVGVLAYIKVGGVKAFLDAVPENYWSLSAEGVDFGVPLIAAWCFVGIFAWNGTWSLVQRFVSVETESDAKKVSLTSAAAYYILFPLLALPPMFAAALIPGLQGTKGAEQSYIKLAELVLPAGLLGLLCFAIFGATVTALNSELNVMAQVIIKDVLKKWLEKYSEKTKLLLSRVTIIVIMVMCAGISLKIRAFGGAFKYLITVLGMTTLPTFVPMLLGLLYKKTPAWGSIAAFLVGITVSVVLKFVFGVQLAVVIFANGIATAAVMFIVGEIWPVAGVKRVQVEELFERLRRQGAGDADVNQGVQVVKGAMLPLVAVCLLVMAIIIALTSIPLFGEPGFSVSGLVTACMFALVALVLLIIRLKLKHSVKPVRSSMP